MKYDIFISFKHSDEHGEKTRDYEVASELSRALCEAGYSVFFAADTLGKIGSSQYKTDIDAALDESRAMIVVCSSAEYASSQWVKYEWDSFYNDYLSGVRGDCLLYTLTCGADVRTLPRTLRNVQNFVYSDGIDKVCDYVAHALPRKKQTAAEAERVSDERFSVLVGKRITSNEISQAIDLDAMVYESKYRIDLATCEEWFAVNPDIYVMVRDNSIGKVVAYMNVSPVTESCYERILGGDFIDTGITADMLLNYAMPGAYSLYFSSVVIHPDYQNSPVFNLLFNAVLDKFFELGEREIFVRRMLADAVSASGVKFCELFGMTRVKGSAHDSTLYEVTMVPPRFRILSKRTKLLYDLYQKEYEEAPFLFDE